MQNPRDKDASWKCTKREWKLSVLSDAYPAAVCNAGGQAYSRRMRMLNVSSGRVTFHENRRFVQYFRRRARDAYLRDPTNRDASFIVLPGLAEDMRIAFPRAYSASVRALRVAKLLGNDYARETTAQSNDQPFGSFAPEILRFFRWRGIKERGGFVRTLRTSMHRAKLNIV